MTLKTLKDLVHESWGIHEHIKKEAIKWVKHYEKIRAGRYDEAILFMKDIMTKFHNITEEDLK